MSLEKYIIRMPNIVSNELCDEIIKEFKDSDEWTLGVMGEYQQQDTYVRNCHLVELSTKSTIDRNYDVRKKIDDEICGCVSKALAIYKDKFPKANSLHDSGYHLLRYSTGEYIRSHVDNGATVNREISCSIGLNEEYTGGEFYFEEIDKTIRVEKGEVIMFPSNFMFPHEILTVTSGTRYSIITWLS